jgi:hypothetical protein
VSSGRGLGGAIGYPRGIDTPTHSDRASLSDDDARHRIRQLVLSGDNLTKARNDPAAAARARERFTDARALATTHGFDDLVGIIDLRLGDLDIGDGDQ